MRRTARQFWLIWLLAAVFSGAPVAAYAYALGHLASSEAGKSGQHARAACEGAYANLGQGLAPQVRHVLPPREEARPRGPVARTLIVRHVFHYFGRAPPVLPG